MKKIVFVSLFIFAFATSKAQDENILLTADFWKQKPTVAMVQAEIARGANPAELNARSFDPTTLAINNNAPNETIKFLLNQAGNTVDKITHDSRIYLHWAAMRGNTEMVEYLIKKGAALDVQDSKESEPIVFGISSPQMSSATLDAFFNAGVDVKRKYKNGANLLLLAIATDKDLAIANYLVNKGLSYTDVDDEGNTVFDYAAKSGNIALLKMLLAKGVKPTGGALIFASQGMGRGAANSIEVYKYLVEDVKLKPTFISKSGANVLHGIMAKSKQEEIVAYFLAHGVDVNKPDFEGVTPFMNAVAAGNVALVELLTPSVKNINAVNQKGQSALTMAVNGVSLEMIAHLLSKGADVNVVDKEGYNLSYHLVQSYKPNAGAEIADEFAKKANMLREAGLNLSLPQKDGNTLYHLAVAKADVGLLQNLSKLNINVNDKNKEGSTALHKAALLAKNDKVLKYLLSIGADKTIKTEFEETAYDLAMENQFLNKNKIVVTFLK